jgi:hypothetical protein
VSDETVEQVGMRAATAAVLKILAKAKDQRTLLSRARPTGLAFHVAWEAVRAYQEATENERFRRRAATRE